ncbi:MAG: phasin family protein [Pseudomonadota bacterium]
MKTTNDHTTMPLTPLMGYEVATVMSRAMFHAMSEWNKEMAKFIGHRLEMDAKLQAELAACDSPFEAFDHLTRFMQTAYLDYAKEAKTVRDIAATTAEDNLAVMESELSPKKAPAFE